MCWMWTISKNNEFITAFHSLMIGSEKSGNGVSFKEQTIQGKEKIRRLYLLMYLDGVEISQI